MKTREKDVFANYDFTNRVIDEAVTYLESPCIQARLGVYTSRLLDVAYNSRAMLPFADENDVDYFDLDNYEKTDILPVGTVAPNVPFYHDMTEPTLQQYDVVGQILNEPSTTKQMYAAALEYAVNESEGDRNTLSASADAMTTVPARYERFDDGTTSQHNYRPLIVLNEELRRAHTTKRAACVLIHEWSHAYDHLTKPIVLESFEDNTLRTELRAYSLQSEVQQEFLPEHLQRHPDRVARLVERVRMRVNGSSLFTDYAFDPNDEIKKALKYEGLDDIYSKEPRDE